MKKLLFLILLILVTPALVLAGDGEGISGWNWTMIIAGAIGLIDLLARIYPNEKLKGILGFVIDVLKNLSDYLNNKGKQ